jgi:hypothetical protein
MGRPPKPRCARGSRCYHVRKFDVREPPTVGRAGDLCDKCRNEKPHLDEVSAQQREVLKAARVLFDAGVAQEGVIYGTIVCAAWAAEDQEFKRVRDSVLDAGDRSKPWETLEHRFANAFDSLEPWGIQNGVLLVRRSPVDVWEVRADDGELTKGIVLEVRDRSATGEDVRIQYEKCLSRFGLPHVTGRGTFSYYAAEESLQMLARPEEERSFHPWLGVAVQAKKEQGKFPDPSDVGKFYEMLRASGYPSGRKGGSPPKYRNLIPACAAWYVGAREALAAEDAKERRRLLADAEARITEHVVDARVQAAPIKQRSSLKRDVESAAPQLLALENEIRAGRQFLHTNTRDS